MPAGHERTLGSSTTGAGGARSTSFWRAAGGDVACVEVKAAASFGARDWHAMEVLRDERSEKFRGGFLLYAGERTLPLGDRLWAVPISALWRN